MQLETRQEIYNRYCAGESIEDLADKYEVKPDTIKCYIRYFRRREEHAKFAAEQEHRNMQIEPPRIQEPLMSTAEYLYSILHRLPDDVVAEILKSGKNISVMLRSDEQTINLCSVSEGENGKAD
jgi:predicted nucleotidyltransferase